MADELKPDLIGELLGLLAHDLRNPLSALHSNVGYLSSLSDRYDADAQEAIADALLSCDGLRSIIDSVEILSHHLTGSLDYPRSPFPLAPMLQEAASSTLALATSHEVTLKVDESCSRTTARVFANREMALRSLTALIRNSIQHAPPGSSVHVELAERLDAHVVVIHDNGTPLAPEVVDSAFTAAGQIATKTIRGGRYSRGLGLYCARTCAEAAGAVAKFHQHPKASNAFELSLPREA